MCREPALIGEIMQLRAENDALQNNINSWIRANNAAARLINEQQGEIQGWRERFAELAHEKAELREERDKYASLYPLRELCHKSLRVLLFVGDALNWPDDVEDVIAELRKALGR